MKYEKILIDMSLLYHRAYHVTKNLTTKLNDGMTISTGGIYTSIKMIRRIERDFLEQQGVIYFIFDNVHSGDNRRKDIDPEYKSHRDSMGDEFFRGLDILNAILMSYKNNYIVVKRPNSEADDLVKPIIDTLPNENTLLVSNDLDWARSISKTVHLAKYEKGDYVIYDRTKYKESFGFEPTTESICLYKAIRGDNSDNIPKGIPGIREKVVMRILEDFSSMTQFVGSFEKKDYISDTYKEMIRKNHARLLLNYQLVSFFEVSYKELTNFMFITKFQPRLLRSYYKALDFKISEFDPRVMQFFPEKQDSGSFFGFSTIDRE